MMSLTIMGLTPGPLVRAVFPFALTNTLVVLETPLVVLTNPLVVSMVWGLAFWYRQESIQLVTFLCCSCFWIGYSGWNERYGFRTKL